MDKSQEQRLEEVLTSLEKFFKDRPERTRQHEEEHDFIRKMMSEYEKRIAFWESVQKKVLSTGIFAILSAIVSAIGFTVVHYLKGDL